MQRIRPIHWLAFLIALQAMFYAWFVIPTGDVPDESGHYAYVIDMTKGRPLPVLGIMDNGRGYIPKNLWRDWGLVEDRRRINYIVQHPPLYYAVAAVPHIVASKFTSDKVILSKITRMVSAVCLGLLVIVIYRILLEVRVQESLAVAVSAWFALVPTVTLLAAGISNDIFLALMCGLATLYLIRFIDRQRLQDAYWTAFWLACAGATKMTAWILIAGFLGLLFFESRLRWRQWLLHAPLIVLLSCSTALWWMRRNMFFHNTPFYVFGSDNKPVAPEYSIWDYFQNQPFFDWLFEHFYAMAGFSGYCNSAASFEIVEKFCKGIRLTVVQGISLNVFIYTSLTLAAVLLAYTIWRAIKGPAGSREGPQILTPATSSPQSLISGLLATIRLEQWGAAIVFLLVALASASVLLPNSFKVDLRYSWQMQSVATMLMVSAFVGTALVLRSRDPLDRVLAYGTQLLCLFVLFLFLKAHEGYTITARVSGVHGRYLFPFIPLLIASFGVALGRMERSVAVLLVAGVTIALVWSHTNAYMNHLLPFFLLVRL